MPFVLRVKNDCRLPARCPLRQAVEAAVVLLIALALVVTWHLEWFIIPTGSMADALVGRHRDVTCVDCGHSFACGDDEPTMPGKRAVCPNCGSSEQELESAPPADGDRLLVHRAAFLARWPRRWELAAFRDPARASEVFVKRIAGLPGETIEIRSGDVYADGAIQRKTIAEFRALAILVHDASNQPRNQGLPDRWQGESGSTQWEAVGDKYVHPAMRGGTNEEGSDNRQSKIQSRRAGTKSKIATDWLTYRHGRRRPGRPREAVEAPIDDGYGYNQTRPVVESYDVRDLLLACKLRTTGGGRLALFATDGQSEFLVELDTSTRHGELFHDSARVGTMDDLPRLDRGEMKLELALVDHQLLLALDGRLVMAYPYPPSKARFLATSRPIKVGSRGLGIELSDVKLYRDVYYRPPSSRPPAADQPAAAHQPVQYRLRDDEYFVLGDNSPLSLDSRDWAAGPGVPAKLLLGKPFLVHFPSRSSAAKWWGFQVPDLTKVRYIR